MKNVLLVEDETTIRKGIKSLLEEVITGYKVMWESSNGYTALEIVNIEIPDIVITDIRMPKMDGIEFISLLRGKHPYIPVIVISGHDDYDYVREALKLGVKDYLLKPINRSELASILYSMRQQEYDALDVSSSKDSLYVRQIKEVIEKHLEEELTLNFISNTLNLHPNYISQLFKQETNENLSEYILSRRISKSKELLTNTNLKIYDIAHLVGYSNSKHFASIFKKVSGKTPQQYRRGT